MRRSTVQDQGPAGQQRCSGRINRFVERIRATLLRGGRMTKYKGQAASYSPDFGISSPDIAIGPVSAPVLGRVASALGASVSARALAAIAILAVAPISLSSTGAHAGTCVGAGGVYTCSGAANAGGLDATQGITPVAPDDLTVTTQAGFGIDTSNNGAINAFTLTGAGGSANLTFTDNYASAITGGDSGIEAVNNGSGFLTITTTGVVTGTTARGILAGNTAAGTSITINAQGDVLGNVDGIRAANLGSGALSITSQAATGTTLFGIYAFNNVDGTDVTVNAGGTVLGNDSGISANNLGSGALSVTSQAVTGTTQFGIFARNTTIGTSITINAQGDAFGGAEGIRARNLGSGALSVTSQAATGTTGRGIYARSFNGTDLTIDAQGDVSGQTEGILARNTGSGALSVTSLAVTGTTASGIYARNDATGTSLTVNAQGDVLGGDYGINARNFGTAGMTITTSGDVTGTGVNGIGIFARNSAAGAAGSVVINQAANTTTTGSLFGIIVANTGGSLTVNALGTTVSLAGDGIDAFSSVAGTDLIITANTVTGENNGIDARNTGTGATNITTTGTVTGTTLAGILANNTTSGTSVTINAQGNVFGDNYGIIVANSGTGALSITSQAVTATTGFGISAANTAIGTSLTVNAQGDVSGGSDGILARNLGTQGLTITAGGNVTGLAGRGINAYNSANDVTASMIINQAAGTVTTGATDGIFADNFGGSLTINALGTTTGLAGNGINADNNVGTTDLTITANTVTGSNTGVLASNYGTGATSVTTTGAVTGTANTGISIRAGATGTSLTLDAQGSVSGGFYGISANNSSSGALTITSQAVTGTASNGIYARNNAPGTSLTIDAQGAVLGGTYGITADNRGIGALSITSQAVTGTANTGIRATNRTASTSLTVDAQGTVLGGTTGIRAENRGSGALSITSQTVTGTANSGISAANRTSGTSLTVDAQGTVLGGFYGIFATNSGSGALSVTSQVVTGAGGAGISARNDAYGTSLTIDAQSTVSGGTTGIRARNFGTAGLTITAGGDVTGLAARGIDAYNSANDVTASLVINQAAGTVTTGATDGIYANNFGGSLTINALGTSIGTANAGIRATNGAGTTNLTITASVTTGGEFGVLARNYGTGATSITTTGTATGNTFEGIYARNLVGSTDLIINTQGDVTGANRGIFANNQGTGITSITTTGVVTGNSGDGIRVYNSAAATGAMTLIIGPGSVTGADDGISAYNSGSATLTITANAAITGGGNYGIRTGTGAGGSTVITLNAGAAVSATSGNSIINNAGDSTITVNAGASVAGTISLNDGSDSLTFAGGDFSGVTLFDGGDDTDVADTFIDILTFAGSSGALTGANVTNWENVVIGAGSTISFADNALTAGTLVTNVGGTLDATGGALAITGNVTNFGTINAQDGATDDTITVSGNFTGTGNLLVDVDFATGTADTLVVAGDITGGATTVISVTDITAGVPTGDDVLVVDVTGTTAGDFILADGPITSGAFIYDLAQVGNDFFLQSTGAFNPAVPTLEAYPQILLELNTLSTLRQRTGNGPGSNNAGAVASNQARYVPASSTGAGKGDGLFGPIWTRLEGARSVVKPATSTTSSSYDLNQWKIRVGIDGLIEKNPAGLWLFGVNGYYGTLDADISSGSGNGSINTQGFGFGLTSTWYGNDGLYVDGQAQFSWFSSDLSDVTNGLLVRNNKGMGYAFSLEAGKSFDAGNGWTMTPQAQLTSSFVDFDRFTGGGVAVALDDGYSLKGRIGFNLDQKANWTEADGSTSSSKIYGLANLYYEFSGKSRVDVSGVKFLSRPDRLSGEIGVGGSYNWDNNKYSLFGEVSSATSLENFGDSYKFKGTMGVKVKF